MDGSEPTDRRRSVALNLRLLEPMPPAIVDARAAGSAADPDRLPAALDLAAAVELYADCLVGDVIVEREQVGMVNASKEYANVHEPTVELGWQVIA
jgi:hypothetical protein